MATERSRPETLLIEVIDSVHGAPDKIINTDKIMDTKQINMNTKKLWDQFLEGERDFTTGLKGSKAR